MSEAKRVGEDSHCCDRDVTNSTCAVASLRMDSAMDQDDDMEVVKVVAFVVWLTDEGNDCAGSDGGSAVVRESRGFVVRVVATFCFKASVNHCSRLANSSQMDRLL